ncbi:hypothetical protein AMECASPLE_025724 [Ameca splendens]|uniref:Uncharacterized protein n=1 Tax=Ameca splendens TaxID=208324 RepID=A0ABV0XHU9_9TELE
MQQQKVCVLTCLCIRTSKREIRSNERAFTHQTIHRVKQRKQEVTNTPFHVLKDINIVNIIHPSSFISVSPVYFPQRSVLVAVCGFGSVLLVVYGCIVMFDLMFLKVHVILHF